MQKGEMGMRGVKQGWDGMKTKDEASEHKNDECSHVCVKRAMW